jgi:hypothetical protein
VSRFQDLEAAQLSDKIGDNKAESYLLGLKPGGL